MTVFPSRQIVVPKRVNFVNYIQSSGTQYIDTGVAPTSQMRVEVSLTPDSSNLDCDAIFGAEWSTNGFFLVFYQNNLRWHTCGTAIDISEYNKDSRNDIVCTTTSISVNGTDYTISGTGTDTTNSIRIFDSYLSGYSGVFKLHCFKIYINDVLIRDYLPCLDKDGVACLYDQVNEEYVYNAGTGTFAAG